MILHTVNKSPHTSHCLHDCLALCAAQASVLFIEDGVYCATTGMNKTLSEHKHITFYALKADLTARGLTQILNPNIQVVDDLGFVDLCANHNTVQSWY
jgi:tRNA 2-thiouridine synthesizing protein B